VERVSNSDEATEIDRGTTRELMRATLRFNTLIFGVILGASAGIALLLLALVASGEAAFGRLAVFLVSIFLPGYAPGWQGALIGFVWGFVYGAALGALIYRLNSLDVLAHVDSHVDSLVVAQKATDGFREAVLRLHGPSLGVAIGAAGALGLIATTNMLVARGTADESVRARLLSEVLPGYAVSPGGSVVGAIELFAVLYVFCHAFAAIYNALARRP
jgi:hypothetical protein